MKGRKICQYVAIVVTFTLASIGVLAVSFAQTAEDKELAGKLYERAAEAYSKGEYDTAIQFLEQAHSLDPDPVILYNLGRSYEGAGQLDKAEELLVLVQADPKAPEDVLERIGTDLKRLKNLRSGLTQLGQLAVETSPPKARIFIDGRVEGTTPFAGNLEVGTHTILVQIDGYESVEQSVDIVKGQTASLDLELVSLSGEGTSGLRIASYVALGVGGAGLLTGLIAYFPAKSEFDIYDVARKDGSREAEAKDAQSNGQTFATISTVGYAVGFAGVGVGAALLLWDILGSEDSAESGAETALVPQSVVVDPVRGTLSFGWRF